MSSTRNNNYPSPSKIIPEEKQHPIFQELRLAQKTKASDFSSWTKQHAQQVNNKDKGKQEQFRNIRCGGKKMLRSIIESSRDEAKVQEEKTKRGGATESKQVPQVVKEEQQQQQRP